MKTLSTLSTLNAQSIAKLEGEIGAAIRAGDLLSEVEIPDEPVTAIVHFSSVTGPVPQNPGVHFQVVLRKDRVSPSGVFIAFEGPGNQLAGWMRRDRMVVDEVLTMPVDTAAE